MGLNWSTKQAITKNKHERSHPNKCFHRKNLHIPHYSPSLSRIPRKKRLTCKRSLVQVQYRPPNARSRRFRRELFLWLRVNGGAGGARLAGDVGCVFPRSVRGCVFSVPMVYTTEQPTDSVG